MDDKADGKTDDRERFKKLMLSVRHFYKNNGITPPSNSQMKKWAAQAGEAEGPYEGKPENMIYIVKFEPQSEELRNRYGWVSFVLEDRMEKKDDLRFVLSSYNYGAKSHWCMSYNEREMLKNHFVPNPRADEDGIKNIGNYPLLDLEEENVQRLMQEGVLTVHEEDVNGKPMKWAEAVLPDECFMRVCHDGLITYASGMVATLLAGGMKRTNEETWAYVRDRLGEKETRAMSKRFKFLCEHTVKAMKVATDSGGLALIESEFRSAEETGRVNALFEEWRLDVDPRLRRRYFISIYNVLRIGLNAYNAECTENAKSLASFLNCYAPMKEARLEAGIDDFGAHELLETIEECLALRNRRRSFARGY